MDNEFIIQQLKEKFPDKVLKIDTSSDMLMMEIAKNAICDVVLFLKNELNFIYLTSLCGVHYPEQALPLGVVYHLHNLQDNILLRLKVFLSDEDPHIKSCVEIFSAANWMERETFDFYGIIFDGHPNLIRILNVEYMDYHPMRKEYPLEDSTRTDKDDKFFGR